MARTVMLVGIVCGALVAAVPLVLIGRLLVAESPLVGHLALMLVTAVAARIGWVALRLTARHEDELVHDRTRGPVLYLRSFLDDNAVLDSGQASIVTADSLLKNALKGAGPVVGLARPGDIAPPFGIATRLLDPVDDWKAQIEDWIREASLVVIQAGSTDGLLWELETARRLCAPEQLIVSFLAWHHLSEDERTQRYETFASSATAALQMHVPTALGGDLFWCFEAGWQLTRLNRPRRARMFLGQWARSAEGVREVLRASLRARGIHVGWGRTVVAAVLYPALLLASLISLVLLVMPYVTGEAAREEEERRAFKEQFERARRFLQNTIEERKGTRSTIKGLETADGGV